MRRGSAQALCGAVGRRGLRVACALCAWVRPQLQGRWLCLPGLRRPCCRALVYPCRAYHSLDLPSSPACPSPSMAVGCPLHPRALGSRCPQGSCGNSTPFSSKACDRGLREVEGRSQQGAHVVGRWPQLACSPASPCDDSSVMRLGQADTSTVLLDFRPPGLGAQRSAILANHSASGVLLQQQNMYQTPGGMAG